MQKSALVAGAFGVVVVIGATVYMSASRKSAEDERQREMDAKIANLQRQLDARQAPSPAMSVDEPATTRSFTQRQAMARQVIEEGFQRLNTRDPRQVEDAVRIFQEGIDQVDAGNAQFYNGLGRSLLVLGKYKESIEAFKKGQKIDPSISDMISGQGWAYWNLKDYKAAKEKWEQALKVNPKSIDAWSAMAWIYLGLKQRDRSLEGFNVLIFDSKMDREDWKIGRNMAAGDNTDIQQISRYFPMPDPSAFETPATGAAAK